MENYLSYLCSLKISKKTYTNTKSNYRCELFIAFWLSRRKTRSKLLEALLIGKPCSLTLWPASEFYQIVTKTKVDFNEKKNKKNKKIKNPCSAKWSCTHVHTLYINNLPTDWEFAANGIHHKKNKKIKNPCSAKWSCTHVHTLYINNLPTDWEFAANGIHHCRNS